MNERANSQYISLSDRPQDKKAVNDSLTLGREEL